MYSNGAHHYPIRLEDVEVSWLLSAKPKCVAPSHFVDTSERPTYNVKSKRSHHTALLKRPTGPVYESCYTRTKPTPHTLLIYSLLKSILT